jgi:hypothetical protein
MSISSVKTGLIVDEFLAGNAAYIPPIPLDYLVVAGGGGGGGGFAIGAGGSGAGAAFSPPPKRP